MAIGDNFMWFPEKSGPKVSGESTDEWFAPRNAFELTSFKFNMTAGDSTEGAKAPSGSSAGKAKFGTFSVDKVVDSASVALYKACCLGTIFPTIMVGVRRTGGTHLLYLQYIFRYNQVTGITWSGASGTERPTESLVLSFKAMGVQYIAQKADGSQATPQSWSWNTVNQGSATLDITGIEPAPNFLSGSGN